MDTIRIKIKNKETYTHLMWFLEKFDRNELQLIEEENSFDSVKKELHKELEDIDNGKSVLMPLDEYEKELDQLISSYEN